MDQHKTEETEGGGEESDVVTNEGNGRSEWGVIDDVGGHVSQLGRKGVAQDKAATSEATEDTEAEIPNVDVLSQ